MQKMVIRHKEGSSMSILEKVIQAEKEAEQALALAKTNSEAEVSKAREEVSHKEALAVQTLNKQINDFQKNAEHMISDINKETELKRKQIKQKLMDETLSAQKKVADKLFKDITSL